MSSGNIHCLKIWPEFFKAVVAGDKTFEIRKNDRRFRVGDVLVLEEFDPKKCDYTGEKSRAKITYVLEGGQFGLKSGFVCMGIKRI